MVVRKKGQHAWSFALTRNRRSRHVVGSTTRRQSRESWDACERAQVRKQRRPRGCGRDGSGAEQGDMRVVVRDERERRAKRPMTRLVCARRYRPREFEVRAKERETE